MNQKEKLHQEFAQKATDGDAEKAVLFNKEIAIAEKALSDFNNDIRQLAKIKGIVVVGIFGKPIEGFNVVHMAQIQDFGDGEGIPKSEALKIGTATADMGTNLIKDVLGFSHFEAVPVDEPTQGE